MGIQYIFNNFIYNNFAFHRPLEEHVLYKVGNLLYKKQGWKRRDCIRKMGKRGDPAFGRDFI